METFTRKSCDTCKANFSADTTVCPHDGTQLSSVCFDPMQSGLSSRYTLVEEIGRGGMGVLYKAQSKVDGRMVAVKMLLGGSGDQELMRKRFLVEARAASALNHANIIKVHEFEVINQDVPYIVMEYVRGCSLENALDDEGPLELNRALNIFVKVADALAHAHRRRIVHRDLKPSNIMLTHDEDGNELPLVLDFGIAKIVGPAGKTSMHLTQTGEVFGSAHYMSPEQCKGKRVDERSDIYSFGCVMYECLTGSPPFDGPSFLAVAYMHVNDPLEPLPARHPACELEPIIQKAMAKNPDERYQSFFDLNEDLQFQLNRNLQVQQQAREEFSDYEKRAEAGDRSAQYDLGLFYRDGIYVEPDLKQAFAWCKKAADQELPLACLEVAGMYRDGVGVIKNYKKAFQWFLKAGDNPYAYTCLGDQYETGCGVEEDKAKAMSLYLKAAEQDHVDAQVRVARLFYSDDPEFRNVEEALKWWSRAADQGDPESQCWLGRLYRTGDGVVKDAEQAVRLLTSSAEQGYAEAQLDLAWLYFTGELVEQDDALAFEWFLTAAEAGLPEAQSMVGECFDLGRGVEKDDDEAVSWVAEAAENGDPHAQVMLGFWFWEGSHGLPKDDEESFRWTRQSAEQDHIPAMHYMGLHYLHGDGVRANNSIGASWLKRAAEGGHAEAQLELARCYREGTGVIANMSSYVKWLTLAAEKDNQPAQEELAQYYSEKGDMKQANRWFARLRAAFHP